MQRLNFFVKTTSSNAGHECLDHDCDCGNTASDWVFSGSTQGIAFWASNPTGVGGVASSAMVSGRWYRVAGTRNSSTGEIKLYLNGELIGSSNGPTGQIQNSNNVLFGKYASNRGY